MVKPYRVCWLLTLAWVLPATLAAAADEAQQRERIKRERLQAEASFAREEAACASRFAVNDCITDVRSRKREALRALREQELVISDRQRREKAAERIREIEANRIAGETPRSAQRTEREPKAPLVASAPARTVTAPAAAAARASQAADRASALQRRQAAAEADRAKIQARLARREAERKKKGLPQPLPKPPAASAASIGASASGR